MNRLILKTGIVALVLALAVIVPYVWFGQAMEVWAMERIEAAQSHRLLTGLVLSGLLAVDVVLPVPSSVVSTSCGLILGPWWGTVASFVGMTFGCLVGYWGGSQLGPLTVKRFFTASEFDKLESLQSRFGFWMLALSRPIPVMAEASTVFAGIMRLEWGRFLLITTPANLLISLAYALGGAESDRRAVLLVLVTVILVMLVLAIRRRMIRTRSHTA